MKKSLFLNEFSIEAIRDALQKLDDFPTLTVNGLNAFQLGELKKIDPVLFDEIGKRIEADRWCPSVGTWTDEDEKISEERLIRNILYSASFFQENFGKSYKVFQGKTIYTPALAQIAYASGFDACVIEDEKETCWLKSADESMVLLCPYPEKYDINDADDEFLKENEFVTVENYAMDYFSGQLEAETRAYTQDSFSLTDTEKLLIEAEKASAQHKSGDVERIENAWIALFSGDEDIAKAEAEEIMKENVSDRDFICIKNDGILLTALKEAEDLSGDTVIRIKETDGKEKRVSVICDTLDAGFFVQTMPYEIQTFRIIKDGFVKEVHITE